MLKSIRQSILRLLFRLSHVIKTFKDTMRIMIVMKDLPGTFIFHSFNLPIVLGGLLFNLFSFPFWSGAVLIITDIVFPRCNELYSSVYTIPVITIISNTTKTDKMLNVSISTNRCFTIHFKTILFQGIFSEMSEASTIFAHFLFAKSSQSITSLCQRPLSVTVDYKTCDWSYFELGSEPNSRFPACFEPLKLPLHLYCPPPLRNSDDRSSCM